MNQIITKAQNGDKKAMEQLYASTCNDLAYYCRQLCGNAHDAQDLMQDTYLTAFEKLGQYRRDQNFKGWLHTIALHKYYNRIRAEKPHLREEEATEYIAAEEELYAPEEYTEQKELQRLLKTVIDESLSETQRMTIILYYYDEMSVSDIAQELNCPEGTVKTRLYHSRKILREELLKRGIALGGSAVLISAALKANAAAFKVSAASAAAVMNLAVKTNAASVGTKSILAYTKGKIIAGITAAVVVGGTAGICYTATNRPEEPSEPTEILLATESASTEPAAAIPLPAETEAMTETEIQTETIPETSGVSVPGGEPVSYKFDANTLEVWIPSTYTMTSYFIQEQEDGSFQFLKNPMQKEGDEEKTLLTISASQAILFRPDTFSGDVVTYIPRVENVSELDMHTIVSSLYKDAALSEPQEFIIPVDNTNSPDSATEKTAIRYEFTASGSTEEITGSAIIFDGNIKKSHIFIFSDCSGIRQQEYEDIISSISMSYTDNSWRDQYIIP